MNLVGDFGGGGMLLAVGVLGALVERGVSGRGQVVDAAIVDGGALQMAMVYGLRAGGMWPNPRGGNILDGGAPFYATLRVRRRPLRRGRRARAPVLRRADDRARAAGRGHRRDQWDMARWPELRARLTEVFATRTRDEWAADLEPTEACVAAVLDMDEAADHPHNAARGTFVEAFGVRQPAPAPRFSRTPSATPTAPPAPGRDTEVLTDGASTPGGSRSCARPGSSTRPRLAADEGDAEGDRRSHDHHAGRGAPGGRQHPRPGAQGPLADLRRMPRAAIDTGPYDPDAARSGAPTGSRVPGR